MLKEYAHNLWVGVEYVGFGAGGINFHPKHLGGHQNSIGNLYGGGGGHSKLTLIIGPV